AARPRPHPTADSRTGQRRRPAARPRGHAPPHPRRTHTVRLDHGQTKTGNRSSAHSSKCGSRPGGATDTPHLVIGTGPSWVSVLGGLRTFCGHASPPFSSSKTKTPRLRGFLRWAVLGSNQ